MSEALRWRWLLGAGRPNLPRGPWGTRLVLSCRHVKLGRLRHDHTGLGSLRAEPKCFVCARRTSTPRATPLRDFVHVTYSCHSSGCSGLPSSMLPFISHCPVPHPRCRYAFQHLVKACIAIRASRRVTSGPKTPKTIGNVAEWLTRLTRTCFYINFLRERLFESGRCRFAFCKCMRPGAFWAILT